MPVEKKSKSSKKRSKPDSVTVAEGSSLKKKKKAARAVPRDGDSGLTSSDEETGSDSDDDESGRGAKKRRKVAFEEAGENIEAHRDRGLAYAPPSNFEPMSPPGDGQDDIDWARLEGDDGLELCLFRVPVGIPMSSLAKHISLSTSSFESEHTSAGSEVVGKLKFKKNHYEVIRLENSHAATASIGTSRQSKRAHDSDDDSDYDSDDEDEQKDSALSNPAPPGLNDPKVGNAVDGAGMKGGNEMSRLVPLLPGKRAPDAKEGLHISSKPIQHFFQVRPQMVLPKPPPVPLANTTNQDTTPSVTEDAGDEHVEGEKMKMEIEAMKKRREEKRRKQPEGLEWCFFRPPGFES